MEAAEFIDSFPSWKHWKDINKDKIMFFTKRTGKSRRQKEQEEIQATIKALNIEINTEKEFDINCSTAIIASCGAGKTYLILQWIKELIEQNREPFIVFMNEFQIDMQQDLPIGFLSLKTTNNDSFQERKSIVYPIQTQHDKQKLSKAIKKAIDNNYFVFIDANPYIEDLFAQIEEYDYQKVVITTASIFDLGVNRKFKFSRTLVGTKRHSRTHEEEEYFVKMNDNINTSNCDILEIIPELPVYYFMDINTKIDNALQNKKD